MLDTPERRWDTWPILIEEGAAELLIIMKQLVYLTDCVEGHHKDYGRGFFFTEDAIREESDTVSKLIQEAWEACGGNPGIKATKEELLFALRAMNDAEDEQHEK